MTVLRSLVKLKLVFEVTDLHLEVFVLSFKAVVHFCIPFSFVHPILIDSLILLLQEFDPAFKLTNLLGMLEFEKRL